MKRYFYKRNIFVYFSIYLTIFWIACASEPIISVNEQNAKIVLSNDKDDFFETKTAQNQDALPDNKKDCYGDILDKNSQLVVKTMYPGFTPGGVKGELDRIVILANGKVMRGHRESRGAPWRDQIAGELSQTDLVNVKNKLCSLRPGEIKFPDNSAVTDGPSTHYEARDTQGKLVTFFEYSGGRLGKLESFEAADELRVLIDSFNESSPNIDNKEGEVINRPVTRNVCGNDCELYPEASGCKNPAYRYY